MSDLALAAFAAETGAHLVEEPRRRRFDRFRRAFDEGEYRASLAAQNLRFVGRSEPEYPPLLRELHDPPPGLFLRASAELGVLCRPAVAIVGARACSAYGSQVARLVARELAGAGLVVVSGLARGIDGEAHRGALDAGGTTVAVLGCGIDRDYPAAHAQLAARICDRGLVFSSTRRESSRRRGASRLGNGRPSQPGASSHSSNVVPAVEVAGCRAGVVPVWSRERLQRRRQSE
jgi:predicted Rossmann fold nucleotide-binding protein DprA/Smf involved in DNA uptake